MNQTILKKCGIICEYNPLHNGHIRQIQAAKEQTGCDTLICIMSGNFVQRGDGAVLDKYTRAIHAIKAGADIVIELRRFNKDLKLVCVIPFEGMEEKRF